MLPGSRLAEVRHLAGTYLAAAVMLAHRHPRLHWFAPMASPAVRALFEQMRAQVPGASALSLQVLDGQARLALTAADVALITSGTATLEGLLCRCPMVVAYRAGAFTAWLVRTLRLVRLPYFSCQICWQGRPWRRNSCRGRSAAEMLAERARASVAGSGAARLSRERFAAVHAALRAGGAARAAEAVLQLVGQRRAEGMNDVTELIAGVDEAGRGPLAGPVVAAAVILDPKRPIAGCATPSSCCPSGGRVLAQRHP